MHEISISAEQIFHIGRLPITNALFLSILTLLVLIVAGLLLKRGLRLVPGKFQSIVEMLFEQVLQLMDTVLGRRAYSLKYLSLVATIFLFVLTSNWLGLFPFVGSVGIIEEGAHHEEIFIPLFRAPAADLNFTIALAVIAVFGVNVFAVLALGLKKHLGKFFTLKNPIFSFVGILELISEFVKIVSFSFRLFGNIFAGEVLLVVIGFLLPYVVPLPFLFLEVFVGFIQAFIFAMLTLVFVAMAVQEEPAH